MLTVPPVAHMACVSDKVPEASMLPLRTKEYEPSGCW